MENFDDYSINIDADCITRDYDEADELQKQQEAEDKENCDIDFG